MRSPIGQEREGIGKPNDLDEGKRQPDTLLREVAAGRVDSLSLVLSGARLRLFSRRDLLPHFPAYRELGI
jgi:hypothetical protein